MNSWYRMVDVGIWADQKFRNLSRPIPCGQFAWIYLLIGEHTEGMPGLYKLGEAALAESLGWKVEALRDAMDELEELGMVEMDHDARVVFLPNALKYQAPQNPKHLQGLGKAYSRIPECELKVRWLEQLRAFAEKKGGAYVNAFHKGFLDSTDTVSDRVRTTKTKPHTNSNKNIELEASSKRTGDMDSSGKNIPFSKIVEYLNEKSGKKFAHSTAATRRHIRARWNEGHELAAFKAVIDAKCDEWLGTEMDKYIRPLTLFGPKFEAYVNERPDDLEELNSLYPEMDKMMEFPDEN